MVSTTSGGGGETRSRGAPTISVRVQPKKSLEASFHRRIFPSKSEKKIGAPAVCRVETPSVASLRAVRSSSEERAIPETDSGSPSGRSDLVGGARNHRARPV